MAQTIVLAAAVLGGATLVARALLRLTRGLSEAIAAHAAAVDGFWQGAPSSEYSQGVTINPEDLLGLSNEPRFLESDFDATGTPVDVEPEAIGYAVY